MCTSSSFFQKIILNKSYFLENIFWTPIQKLLTLLDAVKQKPLIPLQALQLSWLIQVDWPCTADPMSGPWWTTKIDNSKGKKKVTQK